MARNRTSLIARRSCFSVWLAASVLALPGCARKAAKPANAPVAQATPAAEEAKPKKSKPEEPRPTEEWFAERRREMVEQQLRGRDIDNSRVLAAMGRVPRHRFVPPEFQKAEAYHDRPIPIGHDQMIPQPHMVALMAQLAAPTIGDRVLEIGTGSGYQTAVLAQLSGKLYSVETIEPLAKEAKERLVDLGYDNVFVRHGDGYGGWPEKAPFNAIVVTVAPDHVPQSLLDQLAPRGRLVIPVGDSISQELLLIRKDALGSVTRRSVMPVEFVPMTGEATAEAE